MKTNNLKFNTSKIITGGRIDIEISLNDECKNGHQNFHITGSTWEHETSKADKYNTGWGCLHEDILKHFPKFKPFIALHGCDYKGIPTHAGANGFYFITKGFDNLNGKTHKEYFCDCYRVTPQQYGVLKESENTLEFSILLKELGILNQWEKEAKKAIKQLEDLTGETLIIDSVKTQYVEPEPDKVKDFKRLKSEGYYTIEKKRERAIQARNDRKAKALKKAKDDYTKEVLKISDNRAVKEFMINRLSKLHDRYVNKFTLDFNFDNWIYYNHSNTINFN